MSEKRVCIFCGSRPGGSPIYLAAAEQVGRILVDRGIGLVYGGASVGIMGRIADTAMAAGGEVIGIIPTQLRGREIAHEGVTELIEVDTLAERKERMIGLSDGFLSLPGGAGTMDEFFEVITWAILGHHQKPSVLLNLDGYYDHLLGLLDHMTGEGFLDKAHRDLVHSENDVPGAVDAMCSALAISPA